MGAVDKTCLVHYFHDLLFTHRCIGFRCSQVYRPVKAPFNPPKKKQPHVESQSFLNVLVVSKGFVTLPAKYSTHD
jgi:hypothetical protein